MKGYVFDPSRLRGSAKQREERGYRVIGQMLREHLGDDPLGGWVTGRCGGGLEWAGSERVSTRRSGVWKGTERPEGRPGAPGGDRWRPVMVRG